MCDLLLAADATGNPACVDIGHTSVDEPDNEVFLSDVPENETTSECPSNENEPSIEPVVAAEEEHVICSESDGMLAESSGLPEDESVCEDGETSHGQETEADQEGADVVQLRPDGVDGNDQSQDDVEHVDHDRESTEDVDRSQENNDSNEGDDRFCAVLYFLDNVYLT